MKNGIEKNIYSVSFLLLFLFPFSFPFHSFSISYSELLSMIKFNSHPTDKDIDDDNNVQFLMVLPSILSMFIYLLIRKWYCFDFIHSIFSFILFIYSIMLSSKIGIRVKRSILIIGNCCWSSLWATSSSYSLGNQLNVRIRTFNWWWTFFRRGNN